jgi:hypothetical protein
VSASEVTDATNDPNQPSPSVDLTLDARGARALNALAAANMDKQLAIVGNGAVLSTPVVHSANFGGHVVVPLTNDAEAGRLLAALGGHRREPSSMDQALQRAGAVCNTFHPPGVPPGTPDGYAPTTAGEITREAQKVLGRPLPPWDTLPPDHFVASCSFARTDAIGSRTTLCKNGDIVDLSQPQQFFVDEGGQSGRDTISGPAIAELPACP